MANGSNVEIQYLRVAGFRFGQDRWQRIKCWIVTEADAPRELDTVALYLALSLISCR